MKWKLFVTVNLVTILCACAKPFQPAPFEFEYWEKSRVSVQEIKDAMLKCGYKNVFSTGRDITNNEIAMRQLCMIRQGFSYRGELFCNQKIYKKLLACQALEAQDFQRK